MLRMRSLIPLRFINSSIVFKSPVLIVQTIQMQIACTSKQYQAHVIRMSLMFQLLQCCGIRQNSYHSCTLEIRIAFARVHGMI